MAREVTFFGLDNAKYAFSEDGAWLPPEEMPFAQSLALNTKVNIAKVYGDNRELFSVPSDKGYDGTFGLSTKNTEYEIALGYSMRLPNGALASLDAAEQRKHCIYFETMGGDEDNGTYVIKNWMYNVVTSKSGRSYTSTTDNIEFGKHEMPVEVFGTELLNADGSVYRDAKGRTRIVHILSSVPGDECYASFGDAVPEVIVNP